MDMTSPRRLKRGNRELYRKRRQRFVFSILAVLLVAGILAWTGVHLWTKPLSTQAAAPTAPASTKRFTALIVGADDRPGEPGRSDTMLLAFVDLDANSVKLLSIPRDSWSQIPGHDWDKINAAYALGKEDLTRQAVQNLIGIPVDYTVAVNMQGFQDIVNAVGGVDINVAAAMNYDDPYDTPPLHIHLKAGLQHMMGEDALHYVRFRHDAESDWGRMKRQQTFIKALVTAAERPSNLLKLPQLISLVGQNVRTNLSLSQLTQLAMLAKTKLTPDGIAETGQTLKGDDLWTSEGYYLGLHFLEMRQTVRDMAGITTTPEMLTQDQTDAAAYEAAVPKAPPTPPTTEPTTPGSGKDATGKGTTPGTGTNKGTGTTGGPGSTPGTGNTTGTTGTGGTGTGPGSTPGTDKTGGSATGTDTGSTDNATGTNSQGTGTTTETAWQVAVVDGSGGAQSSVVNTLRTEGYEILSVRTAQPVATTTIFWYSGPAEAAYNLKALLPNATLMHMSPAPGDPPIKLVLGKR
ncbi:MAG: LCP family protein [Mycobacterium leprae]